jgi:hypothetical protein
MTHAVEAAFEREMLVRDRDSGNGTLGGAVNGH